MKFIFDMGGTKTRAAAVTPEGISEITIVPTPKDPEEAVALLGELAEKIAAGAAIEKAVGGIPGTPNEDGSILFTPHLPDWNGFPMQEAVSERLHASVHIEHDANLGALGETEYGAGKGGERIAYFAIGTGLGVGFISHGAIISPVVGFEAGHQIVDVSRGVGVDETVGGNALRARYGVPAEAVPREVYDALTKVLATAIYNSALHWHPDTVVIGGSLLNEENGFRLKDIEAAFRTLPPLIASAPVFRHAALGDASNLWGARALAEGK